MVKFLTNSEYTVYFSTNLNPFFFILRKLIITTRNDIKDVTVIIPATGILLVAFSKPILAEVDPAIPILIIPSRADAVPSLFRMGARASAIPLGEVNPIHSKTRKRNAMLRFLSNQLFVTPVK